MTSWPKVRAVLDTNVVVSALIWGGKPFSSMQAATEGHLQLYTSPALIEELLDVLTRGHLAPKLESRRSSIKKAVMLYSGLAAMVVPMAIPPAVLDEPDADAVIATAMSARVDLIVTGDRHLLALGNYATIQIVTPADAIDKLPARRNECDSARPANIMKEADSASKAKIVQTSNDAKPRASLRGDSALCRSLLRPTGQHAVHPQVVPELVVAQP